MKKVLAALIAVGLSCVPLAGARADAGSQNAIVQGAGLAAAGVAAASVDPNVDFWPIYSQSSMDNDSSHGLSGAIWPGFLLDAFAWLYGLQPQERAGLGISETQWPNPPHVSNASSTGFMLDNFKNGCVQFFGPAQCAQAFDTFGPPPAALGISTSRSGNLASSGQARGARFDFPGIFEASEAYTTTDTHLENGKTLVESVFTARDVDIGGGVLHIEMIQARSVAKAAGDRAHSVAQSSLKIVGADFAGTPVTIDDQGLHAAGDNGFDDFDKALAAQGLQVRGSQGRRTVDPTGEFVDAATGGLLITVSRERAESAFPQPLIDGKNAACESAATSPLNAEITHVRIDQPNPLYGQVPVPGMPKAAQLDQSVPPPVQCPFTNRDLGVRLVIGLTDASARFTPLPEVLATTATVGVAGIPGTPGYTVPGRPGTPGTPAVVAAPAPSEFSPQATLASAPRATGDVSRRVKVVYGLIALAAALAVAGRFVLRSVSSP